MYPINDREYLKTCADIAREMSISLSSAKKKVEIQISKKGLKTIEEKRKIATEILDFCKTENSSGCSSVKLFDELMESLNNNDNFLVED
tara:strand:- start:1048 stop:1314 length:267 start_codon:yes stop_codon:yes gene_type:complete